MITFLLSLTLSGITSAAKLGFDLRLVNIEIYLHYIVCAIISFSLNNTWRCGVFVSEPGVKFEPPLVKYFVLQNYRLTTCPAKFKETWKKGTFSKSCAKMVRLLKTKSQMRKSKNI